MKKKKLEIPLYHSDLIICQADDLKEFEEKYELEDLNGFSAVVFERITKKGYLKHYMCFNKNVTPSVIAHEAFHVTSLVFQSAGIIPDADNDEPQAYLLGWIVEKCHKFLKVKK